MMGEKDDLQDGAPDLGEEHYSWWDLDYVHASVSEHQAFVLKNLR